MGPVTKQAITVYVCVLSAVLAGPATTLHAAPDDRADSAPPKADSEALQEEQDDADLRLAEPDFRLVNLPTTLPLPVHGFSFELTHRFVGNLARGSFVEHAKNLFGLDQGALVGLEVRFGLARGLQAVVHRAALDKTFQFHAKYDAVRQRDATPVSVSALVSAEGVDNFTEQRAPALGAIVSRSVSDRIAIYAAPIWVHNTGPLGQVTRDTAFIGVGGRLRVGATVYLVGDVSPRIGGHAPGPPEFGFGIEKRAGRHLFQLNFTNTLGTTFGQTARGGSPTAIYLGFNLARKFF